MRGEHKACAVCGRTIVWRKALSSNWDEVQRCSSACRKRRIGWVDRSLEEAITRLLEARARGATICPSEAARAVRPENWRPLMERAREAARRLVARGQVEITQGGHAVDGSTAKGPIRIRRVS